MDLEWIYDFCLEPFLIKLAIKNCDFIPTSMKTVKKHILFRSLGQALRGASY